MHDVSSRTAHPASAPAAAAAFAPPSPRLHWLVFAGAPHCSSSLQQPNNMVLSQVRALSLTGCAVKVIALEESSLLQSPLLSRKLPPAWPTCAAVPACPLQNISVSLSVIALVALIGAGVGVGSGIGEHGYAGGPAASSRHLKYAGRARQSLHTRAYHWAYSRIHSMAVAPLLCYSVAM